VLAAIAPASVEKKNFLRVQSSMSLLGIAKA
jgi:hypothetical protein